MKIFSSLTVLAITGIAFMGASAFAEEETDLKALPPIVQKTARDLVGKAKVEEVEPTFENGQHAYEVEFLRNRKHMAIVIAKDGKLIQTEDRMSVGDAPVKIQKAVLKQFPGGNITHIKSVQIDGVLHFEVSVQVEGQSHAINLDKVGKVIKAVK